MTRIKVFTRGEDGTPVELGTVISDGKRVRINRSLKPILRQLLSNAGSKGETAVLSEFVLSLPELLRGSRLWAVIIG